MLRSFALRCYRRLLGIMTCTRTTTTSNWRICSVLIMLYDRVLSSNALSIAKEVSQLVPEDYFIYLGIQCYNFVQAGVQFLSILTLVLLLDISQSLSACCLECSSILIRSSTIVLQRVDTRLMETTGRIIDRLYISMSSWLYSLHILTVAR